MSKNEDYCSVCKVFVDGPFTRGFAGGGFIDGRKHPVMCHCCMSIPKMYEFKDNRLTVFEEYDDRRLHTLEELVQDGFNKKQAEKSLKAVKTCIKKKIC